jgi:hypothetical protein
MQDWDNFVDGQFLINSCLGLVIIDDSTSTIRLVHKSLQDYLQKQYDEHRLFEEGHHEIAHICVTYMSFDNLDDEITTLREEVFKKYALLAYVTRHWSYHARNAKAKHNSIEDLVISLLIENDSPHAALFRLLAWPWWRATHYHTWNSWIESWIHIKNETTFAFYRRIEQHPSDMPRIEMRYTVIHLIAHTGLAKVFSRLINSLGAEINAYDEEGNTPLLTAANYGYASLVKLLLNNTGLIFDMPNHIGSKSPLSCAAKNGHTATVKILLEYIGMNPMVDENNSFETPLCLAAAEGHKSVVQLFLEKDNLDPAVKGVYGQALSAAAKNGHVEVVKLFLEKRCA